MNGTAGHGEAAADGRAGHALVASDKFKGTLSACEVAVCIADGVRAVAPEVVPVRVEGPTGEAVATRYAVRDGLAVRSGRVKALLRPLEPL